MKLLLAVLLLFVPLVLLGFLLINMARWSQQKNEEIRKTPDSTRERIIENMKNYGVSKQLLTRYYCSTATKAETLLGKFLAIAVIVLISGFLLFAIYVVFTRF